MIWTVSRATRQAPSELLEIGKWASEQLVDIGVKNGWLLPGSVLKDTWTPLQFDAAVSYFGGWIENKLNQLDGQGNYVHELETLLDDAVSSEAAAMKSIKSMFGTRKGGWGEKSP